MTTNTLASTTVIWWILNIILKLVLSPLSSSFLEQTQYTLSQVGKTKALIFLSTVEYPNFLGGGLVCTKGSLDYYYTRRSKRATANSLINLGHSHSTPVS